MQPLDASDRLVRRAELRCGSSTREPAVAVLPVGTSPQATGRVAGTDWLGVRSGRLRGCVQADLLQPADSGAGTDAAVLPVEPASTADADPSRHGCHVEGASRSRTIGRSPREAGMRCGRSSVPRALAAAVALAALLAGPPGGRMADDPARLCPLATALLIGGDGLGHGRYEEGRQRLENRTGPSDIRCARADLEGREPGRQRAEVAVEAEDGSARAGLRCAFEPDARFR
ncbi:MAG: hypothetical protein RMK81_03740 [Geminicoccaceae bacterium]|nr:hypothetical protein [Geminicoccaceae bacterium]